MRQFSHTVTVDDTAARVGTGDLEVLATPRLIAWCERAAFDVCRASVEGDRTTVGTYVKFEHVKGSPVGAEVLVQCAEPISDGRRLVCFVSVTDAQGEDLGHGELHRAVVDAERFMSKCQRIA